MCSLKLFAFFLHFFLFPHSLNARTCQLDDFVYEYTECDSKGQRWRVAVPKNKDGESCEGNVPFPQKGKNCSFTCSGGKYLDIESQDCLNCPAGTYSLGGGVRFEDFDDGLPDGFEIRNVPLEDVMSESSSESTTCPEKTGWLVEGGWLKYVPTPCYSILSYSARLIRPGYMKYVYRLPKTPTADSLYFSVDVQNEQCQSYTDRFRARLAQLAGDSQEKSKNRGSWQEERVALKSGQNVITWHATNAMFGGAGIHLLKKDTNPQRNQGKRNSAALRPIFISRIDVLGLAYTEKCTKCPRGTYSSGGTTSCTPCKPNTKSNRGADKCEDCDTTNQYSGSRASECIRRPPCKQSDYYRFHSHCDENQKTEITYKWVQPKVCREDLEGAVSLPTGKESRSCPKCNPGMEMDQKKQCNFCPENTYSDGNSDCKPCPANTLPNRGYYYTWWNRLPNNMKAECELYSEEDVNECTEVDSWLTDGSRIHTAHTRRPAVVLELTLDVPGFNNPLLSGSPSQSNPIGDLTFVYETKCMTRDCAFYFAEQTERQKTRIINVWNGTNAKTVYRLVGQVSPYFIDYSHAISGSKATSFIWAFVRSGISDQNPNKDASYLEEEAALYTINVTNTVDGGAHSCLKCPIQQGGRSGCVPCPAGHYMDTSQMCVQCPPNTIVNTTGNRIGNESCLPCGKNLQSNDGISCVTDGKFKFLLQDKKDQLFNATYRKYDLSKMLGKRYEVDGVKVYGHSGSGYFHRINLTLSGGKEKVMCGTSGGYRGLAAKDYADFYYKVEAMICRVTVIPKEAGDVDGNHTTSGKVSHLAPVALGSRLVGVTREHALDGLKLTPKELDIDTLNPNETQDVHFFYRSDTEPTWNCPSGRGVAITARCDPIGNRTTVRFPRQCPDGTCNGCLYHIIISSPEACPLCEDSDYSEIRGECIKGWQKIHYIPAKHCVLSGKKSKFHTVPCIGFGVEVQILIGAVSACTILLCCLVVCVWKKNRKLEYKYMKLVESKSGKDDDLPAAESCALEEGEEDDQESSSEHVIFSRGGGKNNGRKGLFGRNKAPDVSENDLGWNNDEKSAFMFEQDSEA